MANKQISDFPKKEDFGDTDLLLISAEKITHSVDGTAVKQYAIKSAAAEAEKSAASATAAASSAKSASDTVAGFDAHAAEKQTAVDASAKAAADSAAAAKTSETNAASSASAAKSSETTVANSAAAAKTSETNAANSASAAKTSETNAAASMTTADNKASAAAASASNAASSASAAATYAQTATDKASAAANSASAAALSASNAASAALDAGTSKTAAATSETNAAKSAADAAASASQAAAGQINSDWNVDDTTSKAYIKNRPTIMTPTAHAATHHTGGSDPLVPGDIGCLMPRLTVTAPTGSTVTASRGSTTLTATESSGTWVFNLTDYGTWTVSATLGVNSTSGTITVDTVKEYELKLNYISTTLNDNDWATIRSVSDAGAGANYWNVGDVKTITINGTVGNTTFSNLSVDLFVLSFSHNTSREGTNRIHFQLGKISGTPVALVNSNYGNSGSSVSYFQMNASNTNRDGWNASSMRKTLLGNDGTPTSPPAGSLLAALPSDLRAVMKPVTKYSDNTGGGHDTAGYVTSTTDYLFLLSEFEYHGARTYANSAEQNYQAQYAYYQAGNSKIKYKHNATGAAANVWCRSAGSSYPTAFCLVSADGSADYYSAGYSYGVAPGLCV